MSVEKLDKMGYHMDGDESKAEIDAVEAKRNRKLINKCWVNVTKRVLKILNLVHPVRDIHAFVRCFAGSADATSGPHIVCIGLENLAFVVFMKEQMCKCG